MITILLFIAVAVSARKEYLFDRAICTGLGDRLGTLLTLAALARMEKARVVFPWCEDPSEILPRVRPQIPQWDGYDFPLHEFIERFHPPNELMLVSNLTAANRMLPRVRWEGVGVPAEDGSDAVYTIAWRTTQLSRPPVSAEEFRLAYRAVSRPIAARARSKMRAHHLGYARPYAVFHLRGPDHNTFFPFAGAYDDRALFCTGSVVRRMLKRKVDMYAISNNVSWANELLAGVKGLRVVAGSTAYDDITLLLGASAVIQHAWSGWSSYSTVPALAAGIPLITTWRGTPHRLDLFRAQGGLPSELYSCEGKHAFLEAAFDSLDAR